ncbi:MAG: hypothetical protein V4558_16140 [Gemmatimonadota bacterium]
MPFTHEMTPTLIRLDFTGTVTNEDLLRVGAVAAELEAGLAVIPGRIVDFTSSEGLAISFNGILALAETRRARRYPNAFRTAILVKNDGQRGFARMFQTLMSHSQVTVEIFDTAEAALAWLAE